MNIFSENPGNRSECAVEGSSIATERSPSSQESANSENILEVNNEDDPLEQIAVPPLPTEDRMLGVVGSSTLVGAVGYTTVAPTELGAVPEEDEEAATSSTPSTVVSSRYLPYTFNTFTVVRI